MATHQPVWIQPASPDASLVTTGQEARNYTKALLAVGEITNAQGVMGSGAYQVTQRAAGANLSVDIAAGNAMVIGDDVTNQGTYAVWNDGVVNVAGITVPGSGTFHHRIVLQVQDKFELGTWTGYTAALTAILDTGTGLPAEPNSALTIATIDIPSGSASVTNAMINDYRMQLGQVAALKTADTARASTTALADDPDLQLTLLSNSAHYHVTACIFYTGGTGGSEGDIKYTWRVSAGGTGTYAVQQIGTGGPTNFQQVLGNWTDINFAGTTGVTDLRAMVFEGNYLGTTRPVTLTFQWAQNTSVATNTTVKANSYIYAKRLN